MVEHKAYRNIKCKRCHKDFYKWQPLKFTYITSTPYIKCPNCSKKYHLNLDKGDKTLNGRIGYKHC